MTAYRRLRGKDHEVKVAEFGECILYMTPGITGKDKLDARWRKGVWLGIRDRSGEIIVGTAGGCIKVRSIRRRPEGERWNKEGWHGMRGVPWEAVPGHPDRELKSKVLLPRAAPVQGPEVEAREQPVRRMYIQRRDVAKYGATAVCEGCKAAVR